MSMNEQWEPKADDFRQVWAAFNGYGGLVDRPSSVSMDEGYAEFDAWLAKVKAEARREGEVEGMRSVATWLEGGTPRAWGFQHPCDPPGTRWEPNEDERRLLYGVDAIREAADRIENGTDQ